MEMVSHKQRVPNNLFTLIRLSILDQIYTKGKYKGECLFVFVVSGKSGTKPEVPSNLCGEDSFSS